MPLIASASARGDDVAPNGVAEVETAKGSSVSGRFRGSGTAFRRFLDDDAAREV
jgi:hypothetical protein